MTATAEISFLNRDTLPVCLPRENPYRLVSLWDIVNKFKAVEVCVQMGNFSIAECRFVNGYTDPFWGRNQPTVDFLAHIVHTSRACEEAGLIDEVHLFNAMQTRIASGHLDYSALATEARNAKEILAVGIKKLQFLFVAKDRLEYLDKDHLFGEDVSNAFPSTSVDIRESGNCLAAECTTAAVFHLMRAAEVALRALAKDRQVVYPNASLESRQVGDLLSALDGKLTDLRKTDGKNWPSTEIKDAQIRFYHTAIAEFRDFNEAWRRHMAHAHEGATYGRGEAHDIYNHVRKFMLILARKISETTTTPLCWVTE